MGVAGGPWVSAVTTTPHTHPHPRRTCPGLTGPHGLHSLPKGLILEPHLTVAPSDRGLLFSTFNGSPPPPRRGWTQLSASSRCWEPGTMLPSVARGLRRRDQAGGLETGGAWTAGLGPMSWPVSWPRSFDEGEKAGESERCGAERRS